MEEMKRELIFALSGMIFLLLRVVRLKHSTSETVFLKTMILSCFALSQSNNNFLGKRDYLWIGCEKWLMWVFRIASLDFQWFLKMIQMYFYRSHDL